MLSFSFRNSGLTQKQFQQYQKWIQKYLDFLRSVPAHKEYDVPETSMNLCDDRKMVGMVEKAAARFQKKNPLVVVVGIGGSNLGTQAIYDALRCQWQMPRRSEPGRERLLFADTVDRFKLRRIVDEVRYARRQKRAVILNIISKSGSTTETIANAEYLKKYAGQFAAEDVVVTTDENSPLWKLSKALSYQLLAISSIVGGRYSVFTPVGLFPLAVAGIDIASLLKGARSSRDLCLRSFVSSPAFKSAATLYHHATHGKTINDNFFFRTDLESLGKWYRQLMGESIGKDGKGVTPTVSIGSTDLHSMGQLYLGGPEDKITTFVDVEDALAPRFSKTLGLDPLVGGVVGGRSTAEILDAILKGTKAAYHKKSVSFMEVTFPKLDESAVGAFMQWKMIEMMILGKLFVVNTFNQPNVEEYKVVTKKLLQR